MKKFLAICLTLAMLLGCMTFVTVSAAGSDIMINNCDAYDGGTNDYMTGVKATRLVDTDDKTEGAGSWSSNHEGDLAVGSFQRRTITAPIDATAAKALCFDLYVDDASKLNGIALEIELTSSGAADVEEDSAVLTLDLKNGWNKIVIPMEAFSTGKCDRTKITWFRMFNQTQVVHAGDGMLTKLDNIRFVTEMPAVVDENTVVFADANDDTVFLGGELDTEIKAEGAGSRKFTAPAGERGVAAVFHIEMKNDTPVDISGMNYLVFELYITDGAAIKSKQTFIELTSSGTSDVQESAMQFHAGALADGWNTIVIPVSDFTEETGGKLDPTRLNYIRWFNNATINVPENFQMNLDNVRFTVENPLAADDAAEGNVEKHVFRVFETSEEAYLVRTSAGNNGNQRFSDATGETVYKFSVANRWGVNSVTFTAKVGAQLLLQVSQDDANWTDVFSWELPAGSPANKGMDTSIETFDLTEFVDLEACGDIYIRIADSHPVYVDGDVDPDGNPGNVGQGHGWGGSIYKGADAILAVEYTPLSDAEYDAIEAAADDRSISFLTCSNGFGAFKVDKENKVAGASSLMMNIGGGQAPSTVFATPVDGTGYDALEFELYVSDLALFDVKFGNTQLELTSSGACDQEEIGWNLATIKECIVGEPQAGWNHVVLYFSEAATRGDNPFDITRINFFRFFMVGPEGGNCDMTVGIDNLRLTKAGAERDAKIAAENQAAADKVIQRIDKLGEISLDSIRAIEKAESEFEELTRAQKELVTNYDVLTAARAKYDELKAAADAEVETPDDGQTETPDDGQTETPDDGKTETPDDGKTETPADEEGGSAVIIIVVVAVVVVAAVVVVIILAKKKNKK